MYKVQISLFFICVNFFTVTTENVEIENSKILHLDDDINHQAKIRKIKDKITKARRTAKIAQICAIIFILLCVIPITILIVCKILVNNPNLLNIHLVDNGASIDIEDNHIFPLPESYYKNARKQYYHFQYPKDLPAGLETQYNQIIKKLKTSVNNSSLNEIKEFFFTNSKYEKDADDNQILIGPFMEYSEQIFNLVKKGSVKQQQENLVIVREIIDLLIQQLVDWQTIVNKGNSIYTNEYLILKGGEEIRGDTPEEQKNKTEKARTYLEQDYCLEQIGNNIIKCFLPNINSITMHVKNIENPKLKEKYKNISLNIFASAPDNEYYKMICNESLSFQKDKIEEVETCFVFATINSYQTLIIELFQLTRRYFITQDNGKAEEVIQRKEQLEQTIEFQQSQNEKTKEKELKSLKEKFTTLLLEENPFDQELMAEIKA